LIENTNSEFTGETIALSKAIRFCHWLSALAVFYLLISSWWMLSLPLPSENSTFRVLPFQLHKNVGITLFLLLLAMLGSFILRWIKDNAGADSRRQLTAKIGHSLMYFLLLACCLTGYLSSSFSGWGTELWWLLNLPQWAQENDELNAFFSDLHLWSCWLLILLIATHIGAALYHSFKNDRVVDSMLASPKKSNSIIET
jgi:cytochrome b561